MKRETNKYQWILAAAVAICALSMVASTIQKTIKDIATFIEIYGPFKREEELQA